MTFSRGMAILGLAFALAGCHDENLQQTITNVVSGNPPGSPAFTVPVAAGVVSGMDETGAALDVGGDGQPRVVFLRGTELHFTRRDSSGNWSTPIPLSVSAGAKDFISAWVTANNNFTHVFWREGLDVHYRRVNNASPPDFDTADTIVSTGSTTNSPTAALLSAGTVTYLATAIDRASSNVYAVWIQSATNGGGTADEVPVAGAVVGGAGSLGELFALLMPNGDGLGATSFDPSARVVAGILHVVWRGTDAAFASADFVRHSSRNAASSWSGGATGNTVSAASSTAIVDLLLAGDGDAYVVWRDATASPLKAARRPAGSATAFDPVVPLPATTVSGPAPSAAIEPGTENLHVFWGDGAATLASAYPAANLTGSAWTGPTTVHSKAPASVKAWADSTNRAAVFFRAQQTFDTSDHALLVTRPTGAASVYSSPTDLTAPFAFPCSGLVAAVNGSGDALLAWQQGAGASEVFGAIYTTGGAVTPAANVSQSQNQSAAPLFALLTDSDAGHLLWHEVTGTGGEDDLLYSQKP